MSAKLFIISAPSGTGKSTIVRHVLEKRPDILNSVSCTTRLPRKNEIDENHYFFISKEEFERRIENNYFAEWAVVHGELYGTPKDAIDKAINKGVSVILDIDIQGGTKLKEVFNNKAVTIFLLPPNDKTLGERLKGRGTDSEEEVNKRLANAKKEMKFADKYEFKVVNDNLEKAVGDVIKIIDGNL